MFQVETNAKRNADKREQEMVKGGMDPRVARRLAKVQERREVRQGNQWITENVGLN